ncbi:uncharacterized protein [Haliotis asinina]|uniref:uncharacterized protein n=1 Tax=Haliotis asinina TaxID=109174 RepID=UPI003531BA4B
MEYHTVALIGMLCIHMVYSTEAITVSPFRKPVLASFPSRATDGGLYKLMCNYNGRTADGDFFVVRVFWYRDNNLVVISPSGAVTPPDLDGRIRVEHNAYQHNISININASIDNGSVWWCSDDFTRQNSNNITISFSDADITPTTTSPSSSGTDASSTTSSTTAIVSSTTTSASTSLNDVSKAAIALDDDHTSLISVIAGIVVAAIVIIILLIVVMTTTSRRREALREGDGSLSESFHQVDVRSKYKGTDVNTVLEYVNTPWDNNSVVQENVLYLRSSDVLSPRPSQRVSPTSTGLYAQIYKPRSSFEQRVSTSDVFVDDVFARPCKIPRVQHVS